MHGQISIFLMKLSSSPYFPSYKRHMIPPPKKSEDSYGSCVPHKPRPPQLHICKKQLQVQNLQGLLSSKYLRHKKYNLFLLQMFKRKKRQEIGHIIYRKIVTLLSKRSSQIPAAQRQSVFREKVQYCKSYNINFLSLEQPVRPVLQAHQACLLLTSGSG